MWIGFTISRSEPIRNNECHLLLVADKKGYSGFESSPLRHKVLIIN